MVTINLEYKGDLLIECTHAPSGVTITTDAPVDNQGQGRSFSPTDLAATSLGACMATIMGIAAKNRGLVLDGMKIRVEKEMTIKPTRRIGKLTVEFQIPGHFEKNDREMLVRAAQTCPVHHSLHPDIEVVTEFNWEDH
jgi:putative redox protein